MGLNLTREEFFNAAKECYTREELGNKLGISVTTVRSYLKKYEVSAKDILKPKEKKINVQNSGNGVYGSTRKNKDKYIEELKRLHAEGLNDSQISRELGVNNVTIRNWRINLGLDSNFQYERKFDTNRFIELYNEGYNYSDIAKELNVSDSAISDYGRSLGLEPNKFSIEEMTPEEFQVFLGTLLGDGYLSDNGGGNFAHSLEQAPYFYWKYNILRRFCNKPMFKENYDTRTGKYYACLITHFKMLIAVNKYYSKLYKDRVKYIDSELINQIEPLGIAVWVMDDGYRHSNTISIATQCFNDDDIKIIIDMFKNKFGWKFTKESNNEIHLAAESFTNFFNTISPFMRNELKYKLGVR